MIKKYILFIALLSTTLQTLTILDLSPWLVIENKTKLDFTGTISAHFAQADDMEVMLYMDRIHDSENINIEFDTIVDANEDESLLVSITFTAYAGKTFILNSIFTVDEVACNPSIDHILFNQPSLQISHHCVPTTPNQRYFSLTQDPDRGFITNSSEISLYIKCCNNFKQMLCNLFAAAINATNYLPY